jgi:hypothetical protein
MLLLLVELRAAASVRLFTEENGSKVNKRAVTELCVLRELLISYALANAYMSIYTTLLLLTAPQRALQRACATHTVYICTHAAVNTLVYAVYCNELATCQRELQQQQHVLPCLCATLHAT